MNTAYAGFSQSPWEVHRACAEVEFFIRDEFNNKVFGWIIEFAWKDEAYGPIVLYPTGEVSFWAYHLFSDSMVNLGEPPALLRMDVQRKRNAAHPAGVETMRSAHAVVPERHSEDRFRNSWGSVAGTYEPQKRAPLRLFSPPAARFSATRPEVSSEE